MSETSNHPVDALIGLIRGQLLDVNTSILAQVVSYSNGRADVQPIGKKRFADGDELEYPVIPNVRVSWPSFAGGTAGIKGPVKVGDKCLLIFSQQAIDGSDDRRMFDLQDAYAVMTDPGNAGPGDSGGNNDLTMFFGTAHIRITAEGKLDIAAPGGVDIDSPLTTNKGALTTTGPLTFTGGMAGSGGTGSTIEGDLTHTAGTLSSEGVVLATHIHSGVQTGPSNTGQPV